ncbi:ATP-binding protein [Bradyrhizobium elkanii]|nr:ATP-binding protein [Bradyrhizobium elkanii]
MIRRCSLATILKLSVIDSGTGMSPDVLKRAIEPFFSSKPVGKGTGSACRWCMGSPCSSGGELQLSSAVGEGTTAALVLPIATAVPEVESPGACGADDQALGGDPAG